MSARLQAHKYNLLIANGLYLFPIDKSSFVFSAFSRSYSVAFLSMLFKVKVIHEDASENSLFNKKREMALSHEVSQATAPNDDGATSSNSFSVKSIPSDKISRQQARVDVFIWFPTKCGSSLQNSIRVLLT